MKSLKLIIWFSFLGFTLFARSEEIKFQSFTPSIEQLLSGNHKTNSVDISGNLYLPEGPGPFPVLVWVHSSGHVRYDYKIGWIDRLKEITAVKGIGLFVIDSYTARGIQSTIKDQTQLPMAPRLVDAFYAAKSLAKNDKVIKSKIFISGHSFGGLIARNTASVAIINSLKDVEVKFAGHIPISPECLTQPADMKYDFSPMLIVIGENDQQTPAKNCSNFIKALPPDYPIEVSTLKGGDHNIYDTSVTSMELESWDACGRWVFDDKGSYTLADLDNMQVNNNNFKVLYSKCIKQIKVDERGSEGLRSQVEDSIAGFLSKNAIKQ